MEKIKVAIKNGTDEARLELRDKTSHRLIRNKIKHKYS